MTGSEVLRVLRVLTRPNLGGPMRQLSVLFPVDPQVAMQTLIAVGTCGAGETEMDLPGMPEVRDPDPQSRGLFRLRRLGRSVVPWRDLRAVGELRGLIRAFRPHVVHTHTSQAGWFGRRAAVREGVPVVAHTFHGHVLADYYGRAVTAVLRRLEARLARDTGVLLAVSPSCRDEIHRFGIGQGRVEVIPAAHDLAGLHPGGRVAARQRLGLLDRDFALGLAGRLVPVKQPSVFAELVAALGDVRGLVFGGGPLLPSLRNRPGVELLGPRQDLPELLPGLDALVLCSRREGCPLVALEAFAAGVPVVGFDVPGVRDVLTGWGRGLLVPPAAGVPGLVAAVRRLQREEGLAAALTVAAVAGLSRFAPAAVAATLRGHYDRALARRSGPVADRAVLEGR